MLDGFVLHGKPFLSLCDQLLDGFVLHGKPYLSLCDQLLDSLVLQSELRVVVLCIRTHLADCAVLALESRSPVGRIGKGTVKFHAFQRKLRIGVSPTTPLTCIASSHSGS